MLFTIQHKTLAFPVTLPLDCKSFKPPLNVGSHNQSSSYAVKMPLIFNPHRPFQTAVVLPANTFLSSNQPKCSKKRLISPSESTQSQNSYFRGNPFQRSSLGPFFLLQCPQSLSQNGISSPRKTTACTCDRVGIV